VQLLVNRVTTLAPLDTAHAQAHTADPSNLYLDALVPCAGEGAKVTLALPLCWQFVAANHPGLWQGARRLTARCPRSQALDHGHRGNTKAATAAMLADVRPCRLLRIAIVRGTYLSPAV